MEASEYNQLGLVSNGHGDYIVTIMTGLDNLENALRFPTWSKDFLFSVISKPALGAAHQWVCSWFAIDVQFG